MDANDHGSYAVTGGRDTEEAQRPTKFEDSTGNVFKDLGFPAEEADNLKIRSELMIHVLQVIESRGLKQREAAELFSVTQPRISDLVRGNIDLFSIDMLVTMLTHAGVQVSVVIEPAAA